MSSMREGVLGSHPRGRRPGRLAAALVLLGIGAGAQAGSVAVTPSASTVGVGDLFTVEISGADFAENVVGFGFEIAYDTAVVDLVSAIVNPGIWSLSQQDSTHPTFAKNDVGGGRTRSTVIGGSVLPLGPVVAPTGDFPLATLTFDALALGSTELAASNAFHVIYSFADDVGNVLTPDFTAASAEVTVVPLPAAAWLLVGAMGVLGLARRRRG